MRITESMITNSLLSSITSSRESLYKIQQTITTGKEVGKPSDDPFRFGRASRFRNQLEKNDQYLNNIKNANGWIETSSGYLDSIYNNLLTLKEKAVQASDEAIDSEQRAVLANEVNSLIEEMVSVLNETYLDKNLFAGTDTKIDEVFSYDGSAITYSGNTGAIKRKVTEQLTVNINVTGQDLMDANIFASALDLKTALENNDTAVISGAITSIDSAMNNVVSLNTGLGSILNQLSLAEDRLNTANINLTSYLSDAEDVDLAEAITKYNAEEMAYQAALQAASSVMDLNLMDYL